jgi:hypothetical protein
MTRSKWFQPLFAVGLGLLFLTAMWMGGDARGGVYALGVMVAFGGLILLGGRSETVRGLRGDGRDERFRQIDLAATAIAGMVLITAIIGAFLNDEERRNLAQRLSGLLAQVGNNERQWPRAAAGDTNQRNAG